MTNKPFKQKTLTQGLKPHKSYFGFSKTALLEMNKNLNIIIKETQKLKNSNSIKGKTLLKNSYERGTY